MTACTASLIHNLIGVSAFLGVSVLLSMMLIVLAMIYIIRRQKHRGMCPDSWYFRCSMGHKTV